MHATNPALPSDNALLPSLHRWLQQRAKRIASISILGVLLDAVASVLEKMKLSLLVGHFHLLSLAIQALVLLVLIVLRPAAFVGNSEASASEDETARAATKEFQEYWVWPWLGWMLLYVLLFCQSLMSIQNLVFEVLTDTINKLDSVFVLMCVVVLARPTQRGNDERAVDTAAPVQSKLVLVVLLFMAVEVLLCIGLASGNRTADLNALLPIFEGASGLIAGVSLALLISRLDSLFVDPPRHLVAVLYVYPVIQMSWVAFRQYPTVAAVMEVVSLALKCLLFAYVAWLLDTGLLMYYMERSRNEVLWGQERRALFVERIAGPPPSQ